MILDNIIDRLDKRERYLKNWLNEYEKASFFKKIVMKLKFEECSQSELYCKVFNKGE